MICGYLESQGIEATYSKSIMQPALKAYTGAMGPHEVYVHAAQLAAAREALASRET